MDATGSSEVESLQKRVEELEKTVKSLMATVTKFYELYNLSYMGVPRPDGGDIAEVAAEEEPQGEKVYSAVEAEALSPYQYQPLSAERSEIRLLAINTKLSATDPIHCRLITVSLNEEEPAPTDPNYYTYVSTPQAIKLFTPLSYTWGPLARTERIVVDGEYLLVTKSLHSALAHFRNTGDNLMRTYNPYDVGETFWWIDAICINQEDLDERSSQVMHMTRLYQKSTILHVWLGEESDDSARAMRLVRDLGFSPATYEDLQTWNYMAEPGQTHMPAGPGKPAIKLPEERPPVLPEDKVKNYKSLINLFQRQWFSRVWIRQEVALPKSVYIHCGSETCTYEVMMKAVDLLTYLADELFLEDIQVPGIRADNSFATIFRKVVELDEIRNSGPVQEMYIKPTNLMFRARDCGATDPRDKVYAMLPLINPVRVPITADYRLEPGVVFRDTALKLFNVSIDYLTGCQNPSRADGLPSWVPNLNKTWSSFPTEVDLDAEYEGRKSQNPKPEFLYDPKELRLDVRGKIADTVLNIDRQSYIGTETSNTDVEACVDRWWQFYEGRKEEFRKTRISMYGTYERYRDDWVYYVLQDHSLANHRAKGSNSRFTPMKDRKIDNDPTFKRFKNSILDESLSYDDTLDKKNNYGELRRVSFGRRFFCSAKGASGLIPADAQPGDQLCHFVGSNHTFVIRRVGNDKWVLVGEADVFHKWEPWSPRSPGEVVTISLY